MVRSIKRQLVSAIQFVKQKYFFAKQKSIYLFSTRPVLYQGLSYEAIQQAIDELQAILHSNGFLSRCSGRFDEETRKAVEAFQQKNGLQVDGIVSSFTWAALYYPCLSRHMILSIDVQGKVRDLQELLQQEGFNVTVDGTFGKKTESALKRFQKRYNLNPDGRCGPMTWAILLSQRQKVTRKFPGSFYLVSGHGLFLLEQLLMVVFIGFGIYLSPLGQEPPLPESLATAYGLSYVVSPLMQRLGLKQVLGEGISLLQYAPYVLIGFLWKPVLDILKVLISQAGLN